MTEALIHKAILQYLRLALPKAIIHHSANEVALSGADVARAIGKAKGLGMAKGFPDLIVLPFAHIGPLFFEVKTPKGKLTETQAAMLDRLGALGYRVAVVRSVQDVVDRLTEWHVWREPVAKS
jgi:hypothetical protein